MPRIRSIYPEACRSRKLAALTPAAERCWWRLQTHLDDHGRAEDEPDIFASVLFQVMRDVTPGMVDNWLWEMAEVGLIERYRAGETDYLQVLRWTDFQHPQKPKASTLPPADSRTSTRRVHDDDGTAPRLFADGEGGDGRGDGYGKEGESEGEPAPPSLPVDKPVTILNYAIPQSIERITASQTSPLLDKLDHLKIVHSEHYPHTSSGLPDPYVTDRDAPASSLPPPHVNHQGAKTGDGAA